MAEPARDDEVGLPPPGEALSPTRAGRSLRQAVATSAVLLILVVSAYVLGADYFFWLAAVVVVLALYELLSAARIGEHRPARRLALPVTLGSLVAAYFWPGRPEFLLVGFGVAVVGSFLLALRPGRGTSSGTDTAWTVLGIAWIGGGGAAAVSILALADGLNLLVAVVLITAVDDVAAYFVGTRLGRHKMAPSISPSKSWEGLAGGVVMALVGGVVAGALLDSLGIAHGLAIGAIVSVFAPAGDLAESLVKRELKIKDSSQLLPGHGGFLDRLDAILFCAAPVLAYLRIVVF
jgi:phosphatidate cytidylyltransferase